MDPRRIRCSGIRRCHDCNSQTQTTTADAPLPTGRIICESTTSYDGLNRVVATTDAAGGQTLTRYDTLSRKTAQATLRASGTWEWNKVAYDADSHQIGQCRPDGYGNTATDSAVCAPAADATHKFGTRIDYDAAGRATTVTAYRETSSTDSTVESLVTHLTYDADGNELSTTDAANAVTTSTYDVLVPQDRCHDLADRQRDPYDALPIRRRRQSAADRC